MKYFLFLFIVCLGVDSIAQAEDYFQPKAKSDSVAYSKDYEFTEGIYLHSADFRNNSPITKEQIVIDYPKTELDFWDQMILKQSFKYKDFEGIEHSIPITKVWGIYYNKSLYFNSTYGFKKFLFIGSLSLIENDERGANSIYSENKNILGSTANALNYGIPKYSKYVFDFQDKELMDFNVSTMKQILKRDTELSQEFKSLSNKKQKQMLFIYLRKYNEKHPFYLPSK